MNMILHANGDVSVHFAIPPHTPPTYLLTLLLLNVAIVLFLVIIFNYVSKFIYCWSSFNLIKYSDPYYYKYYY